MATTPTLISIQIGQPESREPVAGDTSERPWRTAFYKTPVEGPVRAARLALEGDSVADTRVHGGADKAVCCYSAEHFPYWRERLAEPGLGGAAFGENFTVSGLTEEQVRLGDRWRVGTATFEVSQPRQPCWKLARRWRRKELALWVQQTGYTGWYLRVVAEGHVTAGDEIQLVERPLPVWTIHRANGVMYGEADEREVAALVAVGPLAESWKRQLGKRLR
ncbi:MOSC domain-containing protein [Botrimarina sp.]|uniref:MOSC domain-containing protein n=1 Tax=Botrimarina sp. TaxID=2795802 RepID=UPI0032ECED04